MHYQLDIVKLVENMQKFKVIFHLLLSKYQRALIPYLGSSLLNHRKYLSKRKTKEKSTLIKHLSYEEQKKIKTQLKQVLKKSDTNRKDNVLLKYL